MRKRGLFCLLSAIAAFGILIAGCDLFEKPGDSGGSITYEPLIIKGSTINGDDVEVEITRETVSRAVLTPADGDYYVLRVNKEDISSGKIRVGENRMVFYPSGEGAPFTATYTGGSLDNAYIYIYELPTKDGGVAPILPSTPTPSAANEFAAALNADYGAGTAAAGADIVTLLKNVSLTKTLTIPAGVTLVVPSGRTLTADGSARANLNGSDPDVPVGSAVSTGDQAGNGSYQIAGSGTLDVTGTLVVRNRTLRVAKTILNPTATYTFKKWGGTGVTGADTAGFVSVSFTSILELNSGTLEVEFATVTPKVEDTVNAYTFTLKGKAELKGPFSFADSSNTRKDNIVITSGAELTIGTGGSIAGGGEADNKGTIIVNSGRTLALPANLKIKTGSVGKIDVKGTLNVATDFNDFGDNTVVLYNGVTLQKADVAVVTDVITLDSNARFEIKKNGAAWDHTLIGGTATLAKAFNLTATDTYIVSTGATLELGQPVSGAGGKILVNAGIIIFSVSNVPTGNGTVEVSGQGKLEIAVDTTPANNWKIIGGVNGTVANATNEYYYSLGAGASIVVTPETLPNGGSGMDLFNYTFKGGTITARTLKNNKGIVWMDVPYTIEAGARLVIPSGSRAILVGNPGYMTNTVSGPDQRAFGFGTIDVKSADGLDVQNGGQLALDGSRATLTVPSSATDITSNPRIGRINMTGQTLVINAGVTSGNWSSNVLTGVAYPP